MSRPHPFTRLTVCWLTLAIPWGTHRAAAAEPPDARRSLQFDRETTAAIARGIDYLLGEIEARPSTLTELFGIGQIAFEAYALLVAGVSPDHPVLKRSFETLRRSAVRTNSTYMLSTYVFALDAAIVQQDLAASLLRPGGRAGGIRRRGAGASRWLSEMRKAVRALLKLQGKDGAWSYGDCGASTGVDPDGPGGRPPGIGPGDRWTQNDHSNTQFAVLALAIAAENKVPVPSRVWDRLLARFLTTQETKGEEVRVRLTHYDPGEDRRTGIRWKDDGRGPKSREPGGRTVVADDSEVSGHARGWGYVDVSAATWNMTCAGLSSLLLVRPHVGRRLRSDEETGILTALRDGYAWLLRNWRPLDSYYAMYSLEKVASLGRVRVFGHRDWYEQVTERLLVLQEEDGSWRRGQGAGEVKRIATAFALLILSQATSLVTENPSRRAVVTGARRAEGRPEERGWVHLPTRKTWVHYPTLEKLLRLGATYKLMSVFGEVAREMPPGSRGLLVPGLLSLTDDKLHPKIRDAARDMLSSVTGLEDAGVKTYERWSRDWNLAKRAGERQDRQKASRLLAAYDRARGSAPLKKMVGWALVRCRVRKAVPRLAKDLGADGEAIRRVAYESLQGFFTRRLPEFDPAASPEVRARQRREVRDWLKKVPSSPEDDKM